MLSLAWVVGAALAQDDALWYSNLPVAQVTLEASSGSLPPDYLEPLLRVRQGTPLDPGAVRQDVALLYRAGEFSAVEAVATPWTVVDESDRPQDAVLITYLVESPPRVEAIEVTGVRGIAKRLVVGAIGKEPGDTIYVEGDLPRVQARVVRALASEGWLQARAEARLVEDGRGRRVLRVAVEAGVARRYGQLDVTGARVDERIRRLACPDDEVCRVSSARVRRWLQREGVSRGRRFVRADYEQALEHVRQQLLDEGWLEARITAAWFPGAELGEDTLTLRIDLGPRLQLAVTGGRRVLGRAPRERELADVLGLYGGERVTRGSVEEAERQVQAWFDERGRLEAEVAASLAATADGRRLTIDTRPGPRTRLRRIQVRGAEAFAASWIEGALREADPEGLGQRVVSRAGIDRAMRGVKEFYRGQGFLETKLELVGIDVSPGVFVRGKPAVVTIGVEEGPRTLLAALVAEGGNGLEAAIMAGALARMADGPYSPSALDALARELVDAYQAQGFLYADARVDTTIDTSVHRAHARVLLRPGRRILLRSVVIQGNRRTRRRIVEREVAVEVGQPLTPDTLAMTRSQLYDLDLFRVVNTQVVGDDDRSRDLLLVLDEKPNILLEAGGGVATDQGFRVRGRAAHRNLGGRGHKLTLLGQVGLLWASDSWRLDTGAPVWRAAATYAAPHVPGRGQELVIEGLLLEAVQEPSFRVERSGGSVSLRADRGIWEGAIGYKVQLRRLEDVDPGGLVVGDPWLPYLDLADDLSGRERVPSAARLHAGPALLLLADGRNDRFNPTRGTVFSGVFEATDGLLSAPVTVRGEGRLEQYMGLGPLVLDLVARVGAGWAAGDGATLPIEERFFLGGSASLRGFKLNSVGPANLSGRPQIPFSDEIEPLVEGAGVRGNSTHWVSTGGDTLLAFTTELRIPLPVLGLSDLDSASLVLFNDLGRVAFRDGVDRATSAILGIDPWFRASVGTGLRVATPIGPASLAVGANPWPIKARDESRLLVHLSLGEL